MCDVFLKNRQDLPAIRSLPIHQFRPDTLSLGDASQFPSLRKMKPVVPAFPPLSILAKKP